MQAEDPDSKEIWGYDDEGNKVLLVGEDGERLVPEQVAAEVTLAGAEEEDDPMSGITKLTDDIKAQTEKAKRDKSNMFGNPG